MPADALRTVQLLAQRLGREPTLVELFQYAGADPSGVPQGEMPEGKDVSDRDEPGPAFLRPQSQDGPMTDFLRVQEVMRSNPGIAKRRDELLRELLFGYTDPYGRSRRMRRPFPVTDAAPPSLRLPEERPPQHTGGGSPF